MLVAACGLEIVARLRCIMFTWKVVRPHRGGGLAILNTDIVYGNELTVARNGMVVASAHAVGGGAALSTFRWSQLSTPDLRFCGDFKRCD